MMQVTSGKLSERGVISRSCQHCVRSPPSSEAETVAFDRSNGPNIAAATAARNNEAARPSQGRSVVEQVVLSSTCSFVERADLSLVLGFQVDLLLVQAPNDVVRWPALRRGG